MSASNFFHTGFHRLAPLRRVVLAQRLDLGLAGVGDLLLVGLSFMSSASLLP
jgi:hypothetical protein